MFCQLFSPKLHLLRFVLDSLDNRSCSKLYNITTRQNVVECGFVVNKSTTNRNKWSRGRSARARPTSPSEEHDSSYLTAKRCWSSGARSVESGVLSTSSVERVRVMRPRWRSSVSSS